VSNDANDLRQRMRAIRDKQPDRVSELHAEAKRLTDWREYVRSAPVVAAASSAVAGFAIVNSLMAGSKAVAISQAQPQVAKAGVGATSMLTALVAPIAIRLAKQYAAQALNNFVNRFSHGNQPPNFNQSERHVPIKEDVAR
jgi:hypothetical protein